MAHARKTIRDTVVTSLTGLATTGTNVFDTRVFPIAQGDLPCLCVYTTDESSEQLNAASELSRSVQVVVRGFARATSAVEDTLDLIAVEVEEAFAPGASAKYWTLTSTESEIDGDADNQIASITMTFDVLYHTTRGDGETAFPGAGASAAQIYAKQFETVADMIASARLKIDDMVITQGYTTAGDGSGATYRIVAAATGTADAIDYIDLTGITGQAERLPEISIAGHNHDALYEPLDAAIVKSDENETITGAWAFSHASGITAASLKLGTSGPTITTGTGSPESVVTAPVGSMYTRTDGGTGTTLYVKESGTGNTGWAAK